ncbi:MAG: PilT/PilU family type 4a pilus ATPase [Methylacidiphilales bacterium]|nr:PilT/PilU family type 4a pilus ATPase [Candidatus Methylacidiphilales bacterium]
MSDRPTLIDFLALAVQREASDLHLHCAAPPLARVHGKIVPLQDDILDVDACAELIRGVLNEEQWSQLEKNRELDFALDLPDVGRFRGNAHYARNSPEAVFRHIKTFVPDLETLGHRASLTELCKKEEGLILLTGMTGAGKTTTMASMIQRISCVRSGVIITIENPIEYLLPDNLCIVKQREVGADTKSFANGLRQILKQDPDVIIIGEMGDRETMQIALSAAETGHLVIGTLHTIDAPNSIHRILDFFPAEQQNQIVTQLASCLVAVVSQRLLPRADGMGRVIATETMITNSGIRACIRDRKIHIIPGLMEIGTQEGMNTLDESLARLVKSGQITYEEAMIHARDRDRIPSSFKTAPKKKKKGFFG